MLASRTLVKQGCSSQLTHFYTPLVKTFHHYTKKTWLFVIFCRKLFTFKHYGVVAQRQNTNKRYNTHSLLLLVHPCTSFIWLVTCLGLHHVQDLRKRPLKRKFGGFTKRSLARCKKLLEPNMGLPNRITFAIPSGYYSKPQGY